MSKRESLTLHSVVLERKQGTHYRHTSILIRLDPIDARTIRTVSFVHRASTFRDACLDQFVLFPETPCTYSRKIVNSVEAGQKRGDVPLLIFNLSTSTHARTLFEAVTARPVSCSMGVAGLEFGG